MARPKTLNDFPKFLVASVSRRETLANGYTRFQLNGEFDRIMEDIDPHWFWLLIGDHGCVCATLRSGGGESRVAVLTCDEREEPKVAGQSLAYLSPYWQAFHIWMVLDPNWGWEKKRVEGRDAVDVDYEAEGTSMVNGRPVKIWTRREPLGKQSPLSHHYPATNQESTPDSEPRVIPGGWGHENCTLCRTHINATEFGFSDHKGYWICEKCYTRYVAQRDLAFVDEL